ncbi:hypothetical protein FB45DRAFT_900661, partial [Roridomyces roridus]
MLEELFNSKRAELDRSHVQVSQTGLTDKQHGWRLAVVDRWMTSVGGQQEQGVYLVTGILLLPPFELSRSPTRHATKTNSLAEGCITPGQKPHTLQRYTPSILQTAFRDHNHSNRKGLRVSLALWAQRRRQGVRLVTEIMLLPPFQLSAQLQTV